MIAIIPKRGSGVFPARPDLRYLQSGSGACPLFLAQSRSRALFEMQFHNHFVQFFH